LKFQNSRKKKKLKDNNRNFRNPKRKKVNDNNNRNIGIQEILKDDIVIDS